MISGAEALARLREGNRGFVAGVDDPNAALRQTHRLALAQGRERGQEPFAIVLACSDSRVPAELVLGHTQCGAIAATLEELRQPTPHQSANLRSIVDRIRPSVEPLLATPLAQGAEASVAHAVRANIRAAADHLRHGSAVLERLVADDGLLIVGAEYCLETGVVDFFDGVPEDARTPS